MTSINSCNKLGCTEWTTNSEPTFDCIYLTNQSRYVCTAMKKTQNESLTSLRSNDLRFYILPSDIKWSQKPLNENSQKQKWQSPWSQWEIEITSFVDFFFWKICEFFDTVHEQHTSWCLWKFIQAFKIKRRGGKWKENQVQCSASFCFCFSCLLLIVKALYAHKGSIKYVDEVRIQKFTYVFEKSSQNS